MADLNAFLNGRNTINTKMATLTLEIDGEVHKMIECNKITLKIEKNKEDVQTLGTVWKHKKTTSIEGTGTLGGYVGDPLLLRKAIKYVGGDFSDLYFTATLTIEDPSSTTGKQVIRATDVNLDDIPIADFEADDGVMEFETDLTFEGIEVVQEFNGFN